MRPLNRVQQKAIFRTIMAEEYVLIRGMPGSGKTTAIVALIRLLVALGKTVLLTSYTHSAVDNVLIKLIHEDVDGPHHSCGLDKFQGFIFNYFKLFFSLHSEPVTFYITILFHQSFCTYKFQST